MSLSVRLVLVFSLYGLILAAGFQYLYVLSVKRESFLLAENMAQSEQKAIEVLINKDAARGHWSQVQKYLGDMIRQTGIASISILDNRGKYLLQRSDQLMWLKRLPHPGLSMSKCADGFYDLESPFRLPRGRWGKLLVSFHTDSVENSLSRIQAQAIASAVMAFLAIILSAWLMGTWLGFRLERLVPRIESLAKDPENFKPIKLGGKIKDEAWRLTEAFNSLGHSLKKEIRLRSELEAEKAELAAMLVHDFKSPITVIRAGISFIDEEVSEKLPPKDWLIIEKTFRMVQSSMERLHRMVEDVLQLAKMEEKSYFQDASFVDLGAMIISAQKDFDLVAKSRGQTISVEPISKAYPPVLGDMVLLRRVLDNLIYNAIEHTPPGGAIELSISKTHQGVRVSVSDSGPGIPKEARKDIFKKFFQKEIKRHIGNVGLGLALCEKVILRHGGMIGIEDAKPRGACFYFILPEAREA